MSDLHDIDYMMICNNRMSRYDGYMLYRDDRDERAEQMWNEFLYWMNRWYDSRTKRNMSVVDGYLPMCHMIEKEMGIIR